jgi:anti-sigma factor RsiW
MKHVTEEELILYYYGEAKQPQEVKAHLAACNVCKAEYSSIERTLSQVEPIVAPEPASNYEQKLWYELRPEIAKQTPSRRWTLFPQLGWIGAVAALVIAAFLAGRYLPHSTTTPASNQAVVQGTPNPERIILVTVGEHLERSQMLLVEIMSAEGKGATDLTTEQQQARDLLDANRLYRQSAQRTGDPAITGTLDELERVLVEVANGPSEVSDQELNSLRKQIDSQGLLFKIRVIGSKVRQQPPKTNDGNTQKL